MDHNWSNGGPQTAGGHDRAMPGPVPGAWLEETQAQAQPPPQPRRSGDESRPRTRHARTASGQMRTCNKCGEPLTGQFVRALDGTFHLDCFKCRDCGEIVASKFFPSDDGDGQSQYPLCETDYFRRLDLLCYQCGGALRGSYITALDRKYHVDHFTCSLCATIFGAQDSYYEHDGDVYCHYHYSTQYAQRCSGCQTAILKQFVEIFRNGQNQHWHPECYMIHKFWNMRLDHSSETPTLPPPTDEPATRKLVREEEERMEEKVYRIWSVLSTFEESSAACISDMLLHVSNGAYVDGVLVAKRFIWHVEVLFQSADRLDAMVASHNGKGMTYGREAKLLCKKIVSFFALLSKAQDSKDRKLGVTQELLTLVTGLAHYLKLLIRICLQAALRLERESRSSDGLDRLLHDLADFETYKTDDSLLRATMGGSRLASKGSDHCILCGRSVEDECAKAGDSRWHMTCLACNCCGRELGRCVKDAQMNAPDRKIYCNDCITTNMDLLSVHPVSKLQQYIFLLKVALDRLLGILRSNGALLPPPEEPSLLEPGGERDRLGPSPGFLNSDLRSKSYTDGNDKEHHHHRESTYENTLNEVRRLRSTRLERHVSSSFRQAPASRVLDTDGRGPRPASADNQETNHKAQGSTDLMFAQNDAIILDDIPRIIAVEQSRERQEQQRSQQSQQNAFRPVALEPGRVHAHQRTQSANRDADIRGVDPLSSRVVRKFFSELSGLEYFNVRHLAVLTMQPMIELDFSLDELLSFIETKKQPTFWKNLGKAFKNDKGKNVKKKGVFGVALEVIIERDGAESTDGVGPGALRVPAVVEDIISSMRKMDLSVEGVFRKNGNIKKQQALVDQINAEGCESVNFMEQPVVQLAALLKRYLRDLPDPLMTHKLYRLWVSAAKITDPQRRKQCLHMTCCLLPKSHRDCLEILFTFLKWAGSFHQLDDELGSKMDIRNLATVIAPNVLTNTTKAPALDSEAIYVIDAVELLICNIEEMCQVPDDLLSLLNDPYLFSNSGEISSKEILKRYQERRGQLPAAEISEVCKRQDNSSHSPPRRVDTDPTIGLSERTVRPVQDPSMPHTIYSEQSTPPQRWEGPATRSSPLNNRVKQLDNSPLDAPDHRQRAEWRNSAWEHRSGGLGVSGNS